MSEANAPYTTLSKSVLLMGTVVSIRVVGDGRAHEMRKGIDEAVAAMQGVESMASRFDEDSVLCALCRQPGVLRPVPPALFYALAIAREMAELTDGLFDPTVGGILESQGFDRHYLTGAKTHSDVAPDLSASFRDITLVEDGCQVRLEKPMLLDLGAVAKGLAVDLAVHSLESFPGFMIDAGGDIYVSGVDPSGEPWHVGIEDPFHPERLLRLLSLTNLAVCTSGSYKRKSPKNPDQHHIVHPSSGESATGLVSLTAIGPQTVLADAAATAAFLMGPDRALPFIESLGLQGLCVTSQGHVLETSPKEDSHD